MKQVKNKPIKNQNEAPENMKVKIMEYENRIRVLEDEKKEKDTLIDKYKKRVVDLEIEYEKVEFKNLEYYNKWIKSRIELYSTRIDNEHIQGVIKSFKDHRGDNFFYKRIQNFY